MSIGTTVGVPRIVVRGVSGRMTAEAALRSLLRGTGLRAVRVGGAFRLEPDRRPPARPPERAPRPPSPLSPIDLGAPDIVVTAQKRPTPLSTIPSSIAVVDLAALQDGAFTRSNSQIPLDVDGLASTNLGLGRNRLFIRGVADSPFIGGTQTTVAVQIDEARVTFDAPNPDLQLVDMARVEVLKGPQGPLYGSGALGGIYHIVTRRPDLAATSAAARATVTGIEHGGVRAGFETVLNVPLRRDRVALRAVLYRSEESGWIDSEGGRRDSNSTGLEGGRLALRWRPSDEWTIDSGLIFQDIDVRDSQYVLDRGALSRPSQLVEPADNVFAMGYANLERVVDGFRIVSASSFVDQRVAYSLDASASAAALGAVAPARYEERRDYSVLAQELRLSPLQGGRWLAGVSFIRASNRGVSSLFSQSGETDLERSRRVTKEVAVFGEGTHRVAGPVDLTVGLRVYRSLSRSTSRLDGAQQELKRNRLLFSPSAAVSFAPSDGKLAFIRYARAKRPGGLANDDDNRGRVFDADKVDTFEAGFRRTGRGATYSLAAYRTRWSRVQSDYLLANGVPSIRNLGDASIIGIEGEAAWTLGGGYATTVGGNLQRARLFRDREGASLDLSLPIAPAISARAKLSKAITLAGLDGDASVQANYVGGSRLSLDPELDRKMGDYATVAADIAFRVSGYLVAARMDNVLDVRGDSFAFGNPFSIRTARQYTPLRPRTLMLSIGRAW